MQDEKKTLINESYGDDVTIEEDATSFYITDGNGKYDMISIEEKEVLKWCYNKSNKNKEIGQGWRLQRPRKPHTTAHKVTRKLSEALYRLQPPNGL